MLDSYHQSVSRQWKGIYSRRNPYRRPSALGVAVNHRWGDSEYENEYDEKKGDRFDGRRPASNLQYEGLNFAEDTSNRATYTPKDAKRTQNLRPGTTVKQSGDIDKDTETGLKYRGENAQRAKNLRPGTRMGLDGKLEGESETTDKYSAKNAQRTRNLRPGTTVRPDGKLEGESETTDMYSAKNAERAKNLKRGDQLGK